MPKILTINGTRIGLGEKVQVQLNIADLPSHTRVDMPIYIFRGKKDGPVLLLVGGMHGDEVNGIEIVRRMIARKIIKPQKGSVIAVPVLNIYGFLNSSRELPDGRDLNRSFPGKKSGALASRVASIFMEEIVSKVGYGIDFHTGGASRSNYPQIRCNLYRPEVRELAEAFGAPFIVHADYRERSFRKEAWKNKKLVLLYEGGESQRFDELSIEEAIKGSKRVMHHLGILKKSPAPAPFKIITKTVWVRAKYAGLFTAEVRNGSSVEKGDVLARITDPYGDFRVSVKAPQKGHIIAINYMPVVHMGDALIHLGMEE